MYRSEDLLRDALEELQGIDRAAVNAARRRIEEALGILEASTVEREDYAKPLVFTALQLRGMFRHAEAATGVQVVYASDNKGWHLIGDNTEAVGDGIWVDREGNGHHGRAGMG